MGSSTLSLELRCTKLRQDTFTKQWLRVCPESSMSTSAVAPGEMSTGLQLGEGGRNICVHTRAVQAQAAAVKPLSLGQRCLLTAGINIVTVLHIWQAV